MPAPYLFVICPEFLLPPTTYAHHRSAAAFSISAVLLCPIATRVAGLTKSIQRITYDIRATANQWTSHEIHTYIHGHTSLSNAAADESPSSCHYLQLLTNPRLQRTHSTHHVHIVPHRIRIKQPVHMSLSPPLVPPTNIPVPRQSSTLNSESPHPSKETPRANSTLQHS